MSNTNIFITVIVVIVLAVGGYFAFANKATAPVPAETTATTTDTSTQSTGTDSTGAAVGASVGVSVTAPKTATVIYTDAGFSPKALSVKVGDTVRFVNSSSHNMWVASGVHPTHAEYDGTSLQQHCSAGADTNGGFDECKEVTPGTSYAFTFTKAGTFDYHNHVRANDGGTITVTQ